MFVNNFVKIIYLLGNILYSRFKSTIHDPIRWRRRVQSFIFRRYYSLHSVPEGLINEIFKRSNVRGYCNNSFIIYNKSVKISWFRVAFRSNNDICYRNVHILFSPIIPYKTILCSDVFTFNIKRALSASLYDSLSVEIFLNELVRPVILKRAKSINISLIESNREIETRILDKAVECFLKNKQYCYNNDLLSINLETCSPLKSKENIYFSILDATVDDLRNDGFIISEETSVYQSTSIHSFVPSVKYELFFNSNRISSLTTIVPLGLEKHCKVLTRWFRPFFLKNSIKELKPIFILSGASGVGKKILLETTAKQFGIHYCKINCNDLISSTSAQIHANFKAAFKRINKSGPSVIHFYGVDLLCYECDSNDTGQLLSILSDYISSVDCNQHVFILTCETFSSLPEKLTSLVLAHHHIPPPNEVERASMLLWLANRYSATLEQNVIDYLILETASFVLFDLNRLLALADLQRYKVNRTYLEIQDFTSALEGMSKVEKANVGEVEWEDVGGVEDIKRAVLSSIETGKLGGLRRTGLLLHGPPGTGKTLLARAVANQVSAAFIPVKGPELLNMYIGQSEANVRQVFSRAKDAAPCILFFDELDSIAPSRGNQSSGGVMDRVVSQLLSEMDSLEVKDSVFVLAATNRPDLIDPALLRPGRLDKIIYVGPFKEHSSKLKVLKAITRKFSLEEDFDYNKLVNLMSNEVTGAQLNAICYDAWMNSARHIIREGSVQPNSKVIVSMKHFESALKISNTNF